MPINQFAGEVVSAAVANGIEPAALLAVVEIESSGNPFEQDGVTPRFLFERHIFHRQLQSRAPDKLGEAVAQGMAHHDWRRATQYKDQRTSADRMVLLQRARAIDAECANRSCSWGLGQVMGFNAPELGFADATSMVEGIKTGGVMAQIVLMIKIIKRKNILGTLNAHDWAGFALRYNGKGFKANSYDTKLANAYARWVGNVPAPSAGSPVVPVPLPVPLPVPSAGVLVEGTSSERVRQLQIALNERNFSVGQADGDFGPLTREALKAFQRANGITETGAADAATLRALGLSDTGAAAAAVSRPPSADALKLLLGELLKRATPATPSADSAARATDPLKVLLSALTGLRGTGQAGSPAPLQLSAIDKLLGGEALAGKKTALAVVGHVLLSLLQVGGVVGAATPTGQIISIALTAFGALGGVSKVDRVIQAIGTIAAKK